MTTTTKLALGGVLAGLVLTGAWWGITTHGAGSGDEKASHARPRTTGSEALAPPALAGRGEETPTATRMAEAPPPIDTAAEAPAGPPRRFEPDPRLALLLEEIKRDAAPDFWLDPPESAVLEARYEIVIARAPSDVLDEIHAYLEARGQAALDRALAAAGEERASPPPPAAPRSEDLRAIRPVARAVLARDQKLYRAIRALEAERVEEARPLLDAVLADEPENTVAAAVRKQITDDPSKSRQIGLAVRKTAAWRAEGRFDAWLWAWPCSQSFVQVESILEPARLDRLRCRGPDLVDLIDRGSIALESSGETLYELLREVQIQTFVEIAIDGPTSWVDGGRRVEAFSVVRGSLREVLDRLLAAVAGEPRLRWEANPRRVRVTREGAGPPPRMTIRYFDVRHLLDPATPPPAAPPWTPVPHQVPPKAPVVAPR